MSGAVKVHTDNIREAAKNLHAGDSILLSGTVYTARDAAHKRICALIAQGRELPFELCDAVIYYAGPTPAPEGRPIGSCGPTTSSRMDGFAPTLYDRGLAATVGKGGRSEKVVQALVRNGALYLCAVGGAGALIAKHVVAAEEIAFHDLGCESIKKFTVENLPLTVAIDCHGGNIFRDGRAKYAR